MAKTKKKQTKKANKAKEKLGPSFSQFMPQQYKLAFAIIFGLAVICYANTLFNGYAMDDSVTLKDNNFVKEGLSGIKDIWANDTFIGKFGQKANILEGSRYRPLSVTTFAIEYQFFGPTPRVSHFVNMLLYGGVGLLIFTLLSRLLVKYKPERWYLSIPFIATVLYITHPLHTDAVANIKGRDEIMTFLGSLLALWYTIKYFDSKQGKYLSYTGIAFFLGLMSKENAITFLAVIPLTVYFFTQHKLKENLKAFAPLGIAALIFLVIRQSVVGGGSGAMMESLINDSFMEATFMEKYATIFYTFGVYLKLLFFPHPLTHDYYPYHISLVSWANPVTLASLVIYVGLGIWALIKLPSRNLVAYGILFYIITFSIVSNFFINIGIFMNERFLFIPSLGFCLVIAVLLVQYLPKVIKSEKAHMAIVLGFTGIVAVLFTLKSIDRNFAWKDNYTLMETDVKTSAGSVKSNYAYGELTLQKAIKLEKTDPEREALIEKAIPHLQKAISIYPEYDAAHSKLADAYFYLDQPKKSIETNLEFFKVRPSKEGTVRNLFALLQAQPEVAYRQKILEQVLAANPSSFGANFFLAKHLFDSKQDPAKARTLVKKAQGINEGNTGGKFYAENKGLMQGYLNR